MPVKVKLTEPFNCRLAGSVMEVSVVMAGDLLKAGVAVETDEEVTENPGAVVEVEPVQASAEVAEVKEEAKRRGRPKKQKPEETAEEADVEASEETTEEMEADE